MAAIITTGKSKALLIISVIFHYLSAFFKKLKKNLQLTIANKGPIFLIVIIYININ